MNSPAKSSGNQAAAFAAGMFSGAAVLCAGIYVDAFAPACLLSVITMFFVMVKAGFIFSFDAALVRKNLLEIGKAMSWMRFGIALIFALFFFYSYQSGASIEALSLTLIFTTPALILLGYGLELVGCFVVSVQPRIFFVNPKYDYLSHYVFYKSFHPSVPTSPPRSRLASAGR